MPAAERRPDRSVGGIARGHAPVSASPPGRHPGEEGEARARGAVQPDPAIVPAAGDGEDAPQVVHVRLHGGAGRQGPVDRRVAVPRGTQGHRPHRPQAAVGPRQMHTLPHDRPGHRVAPLQEVAALQPGPHMTCSDSSASARACQAAGTWARSEKAQSRVASRASRVRLSMQRVSSAPPDGRPTGDQDDLANHIRSRMSPTGPSARVPRVDAQQTFQRLVPRASRA